MVCFICWSAQVEYNENNKQHLCCKDPIVTVSWDLIFIRINQGVYNMKIKIRISILGVWIVRLDIKETINKCVRNMKIKIRISISGVCMNLFWFLTNPCGKTVMKREREWFYKCCLVGYGEQKKSALHKHRREQRCTPQSPPTGDVCHSTFRPGTFWKRGQSPPRELVQSSANQM